MRRNTSLKGWVLMDALLALGLWSLVGMALMLQARWAMVAQRTVWRQGQAIEWQTDLFERLHLAQPAAPTELTWGQVIQAGNCTDAPCTAEAWRDSLLADWQLRLTRDMPGAQTWLAPWSVEPRIWAVGIRWPETGRTARVLPINQQDCPHGWHCMVALGWP